MRNRTSFHQSSSLLCRRALDAERVGVAGVAAGEAQVVAGRGLRLVGAHLVDEPVLPHRFGDGVDVVLSHFVLLWGGGADDAVGAEGVHVPRAAPLA